MAREHASRYGAEVRAVYEHALQGYAAEIPAPARQGISRDRRVAYVEDDQGVQSAAWSVSQGDPCGFGGGRSGERLLLVAQPCEVAGVS